MSDLTEALLEVIEGCESMVTTLDASNYAGEYDWNMNARIRGVRTSLNDAKNIAEEILKDISKRVYCVEVTSTVEQTIKVLAKSEDDAINEAVETAERRLRLTLGKEHDYDVWSEAHSHGDESPQDDDPDIEVSYDD
jgi:hypothetical protein